MIYIFLNHLQVRYNCAKFHHCRICVTHFRAGDLFAPLTHPHSCAAPKMPILNRVKTGYYLELLFPETTKLLGSTKSNITKDENGEKVPYLEIIEAVSIHCNVVNNSNNSFQQNSYQNSRIHLFLINHLVSHWIFCPKILKTFDSESSYIKVWFTDQNSNPLDIEEKISITLVIN